METITIYCRGCDKPIVDKDAHLPDRAGPAWVHENGEWYCTDAATGHAEPAFPEASILTVGDGSQAALWPVETIAGVLAPTFAEMTGGSIEIRLNGHAYGVWYEQHGARGDDGLPVHGDVTGDFDVVRLREPGKVGGATIARHHVSPHGSSGHGNPYAKGYTAEQVALTITRDAARRAR